MKKDNESVILNCKVQSNPEARIEWYRNGVKMYNGSNIVIMNKIVSQNEYETVFESNLYIKALTKMDSANYTCKSENIIGLNQADGKLIILCKLHSIFIFYPLTGLLPCRNISRNFNHCDLRFVANRVNINLKIPSKCFRKIKS